jgi:hypothetical protein
MLPEQMLYGRVLIDLTDVVRRSVAELVRKMTGTKELAQALEVEGRVVHCPEPEGGRLREHGPKKSLALCDSLGLEDEFGGPHERSGRSVVLPSSLTSAPTCDPSGSSSSSTNTQSATEPVGRALSSRWSSPISRPPRLAIRRRDSRRFAAVGTQMNNRFNRRPHHTTPPRPLSLYFVAALVSVHDPRCTTINARRY